MVEPDAAQPAGGTGRPHIFLSEGRGAFVPGPSAADPGIPYNLINYAYGLSAMDYKTYILASAIGIIPEYLAFINIIRRPHAGSLLTRILTSLGLMALLLL